MRRLILLICLACIANAPAWGETRTDDRELAARLNDADLSVAGEAARELGERGSAAFLVLKEMLASGTAQQRWGATVALYRSAAEPDPFLAELTRQLSEPDEPLVIASLGALARLQSRAAPALPALKALLKHEEADIRLSTLTTFAAIGPAGRDVVPDIEPFLKDDSAALRLAAADAMRRIRPPVPLSERHLAERVGWLDESLPRLLRENHVPGASLAIIQHGEIVWAKGFGIADVRSGTTVTTDTVFEAASMSKPILALVAMQFVQEGRLDLDRPLVQYLGHDYLPDQPEHRRITARMALTHRTGFANWRAGYDELGGPLPLRVAPGSEYTYSGEGMLFLQRAIEAIAGQTLDRLARERLFTPLGLVRTSFVWTDAIERDLASGHREDGGFKERTRYLHANAAYSLYTTPTEYARLVLTLQHPELLGEHALTPATVELMLQRALRVDDEDRISRPGGAQSVAAYRAFGWSLDVTPEGDIAEHSGSNSSGFKAFGQFNPAKGSGLVIFSNGDGGYPLREAIIAAIGDL